MEASSSTNNVAEVSGFTEAFRLELVSRSSVTLNTLPTLLLGVSHAKMSIVLGSASHTLPLQAKNKVFV